MTEARIRGLHQLAHLHGVQTAYYDSSRQRRQAGPEALLLVLRSLGAPLERFEDVPAALRERRRSLWDRGLPPVAIAWDGIPTALELRLPASAARGRAKCRLRLDGGEEREWSCELRELPRLGAAEVAGSCFVSKGVILPGPLPPGYHHVRLETGERRLESTIISAPRMAYAPARGGAAARGWGVFVPLYALRTRRSWGSGDFTDLEALAEWVAELGGRVVATLPLLASFLEEPCDPSPYSPVSRLFWNELYLDPMRAPEWERAPAAHALLGSSAVREELEELRASPLVGYRRLAALKRGVLRELAHRFFAEGSDRAGSFRRFLEEDSRVEDYARFRATVEHRRESWRAWPPRLRDGTLCEGDYDPAAARYHLYVQWLANRQLGTLAERARGSGAGLYLDLPLGIHPDGYDAWRERALFAPAVSAGAPPDAFFTRGQDWGFPPLNPTAVREQGYGYTIACLRNHFRFAGILRLDHVMALHRLFWVPHGLEPREGVYVRYPAEELYAILCLESHRHGTLVVGEDLGTVPPGVREAMGRHGIHRTYVVQFEATTERRRPLPPVPRMAVASANTHDMPTFAAFWEGLDIEDRAALGLLQGAEVERERDQRRALTRALARFLKQRGRLASEAKTQAALRGCLSYLGASAARIVLVNLEDLWLETRPQNVPGTTTERPNWRRKARYDLEALGRMPEVVETLEEIDRLRRSEPRHDGHEEGSDHEADKPHAGAQSHGVA